MVKSNNPYNQRLSEEFLIRSLGRYLGEIKSVGPASGHSFREATQSLHGGQLSTLERLDLTYVNGRGKTVPISLVCKWYTGDQAKRDIKDEATMFEFYNKIFPDNSPIPLLFDVSFRKRALLRGYAEGVTLEQALSNFNEMIAGRGRIIDASTDPKLREATAREKDRLIKNKRALKLAALHRLAEVHSAGTQNLTQLSGGSFQRYKIQRPEPGFYFRDFAEHFRSVLEDLIRLGKVEGLSQEQVSEQKQKVLAALYDSVVEYYIEKVQDTLILGDAHPNNFIVDEDLHIEANGSNGSRIYLGPDACLTAESLAKQIKLVDLGKCRVSAAASDVADLTNYPAFLDDRWEISDIVLAYLDKTGLIKGRVMSHREGADFERGLHYFSILRAMHAADVHKDHREQNLMTLCRELTDDRDLEKLYETVSMVCPC